MAAEGGRLVFIEESAPAFDHVSAAHKWARSIALDPRLLFLDEPTAGLDPISAGNFDTLLRGLADALNLTVFLVTHDLDSLGAVCDRVAVLNRGKVLAVGTLAEVRANPDPWIQDYFSGKRGRAALG